MLDLTDLEPVDLDSTAVGLQEVDLGSKSPFVGSKSEVTESQELEKLKTEKLSS